MVMCALMGSNLTGPSEALGPVIIVASIYALGAFMEIPNLVGPSETLGPTISEIPISTPLLPSGSDPVLLTSSTFLIDYVGSGILPNDVPSRVLHLASHSASM